MDDTPTPAPAPMTARLRELIDVWVDAADGENERAHHLLDALTARESRLLEVMEGAEKALARLDVFWTAEFPEGPENPEPWGKIDVRLSEETIAIWCSIRSALATLRAAREGAR